jgi:membrane protein DedA with SNARE-associated domain
LSVGSILFGGDQIDRLLAQWGYAIVFAFVAVESLGVPFPGESALITAALYAGASHRLAISGVIGAAALGAVLGDSAGFVIGRSAGWPLLRRYGRYVRLTPARLRVGRYVFLRHGGKVVFFGRFVTGLRTWAAFLAGATRMPWTRFVRFNASGGVIWALIYGLGYYYFGDLLSRASTAVSVGLVAAGIAWVVVTIVYLRRREAELQVAADLAFPEPAGLRAAESDGPGPSGPRR